MGLSVLLCRPSQCVLPVLFDTMFSYNLCMETVPPLFVVVVVFLESIINLLLQILFPS